MQISNDSSPVQLYNALRADHNAESLRNERYNSRISQAAFQALDYQGYIGSSDATSCLIVNCWQGDTTVAAFHHDGRSLDGLTSLFSEQTTGLKVDVVGGCQSATKAGDKASGWGLVDDTTQANWESLVTWFQSLPCEVSLRSWCIGYDTAADDLCSDSLVSPDGKLSVLMPGTLVSACTIPERIRRYTCSSLDGRSPFHLAYDNSQEDVLRLPDTAGVRDFTGFAHIIKGIKSDDELLRRFSTTPKLEQDYFATTLREAADFILTCPEDPEVTAQPQAGEPIIVLQGEVGRLTTD